jgi:hypothetical protein
MWVLITPIYVNGRRRSGREIRDWPPLGGKLTIVDAVDPELPGRPKRVARLTNSNHRGKEPSCGPLYDPEIISMDDKGFLLRGFNIVAVAGGPPELRMQGWLVKPADEMQVDALGDGR